MLERPRAVSQTQRTGVRFHDAGGFHFVITASVLSCVLTADKTSYALLWIAAALGEGMRLYSFRETTSFTRRVLEYLGDESYAQLQLYLLRNPEAGDVIQAGGGIRKVRWTVAGKGTRGGTRVIYYLTAARGTFFMLDIYAKSEKKDLTPDELEEVRKLLEGWLK